MPMNGFSLGKDVSIDLFDPLLSILAGSFTLRTSFTYRQMTSRITVKGSDGIVRYLELPEGWDGSLEYERQNSAIDDYIAQLELNYYAGLNGLAAQLTQTMINPDNTIATYRFTGVVFKLSDGGTYNSDNTIKQRLDWCASLRIKV